jgi:serine/threonine protein kinase
MNDLFGALKHLQAVKIVHRDIKPENIMWGDDGKIRLTDFGTAI